jgi:hypothetical protein
VTRTRRLEDGVLREEVAIESYSAETEALDIELGLGVDMADIFEVRAIPELSAARSVRSRSTTTGSCSPTTGSMRRGGRPPSP